MSAALQREHWNGNPPASAPHTAEQLLSNSREQTIRHQRIVRVYSRPRKQSKECHVDQSLRPDDVFPKIRELCPECGGERTTLNASTSGVYCRCADCGHVWHKDRVVLH